MSDAPGGPNGWQASDGKWYPPAHGAFVYISVQNRGDSGSVTCSITVDNVVVAENTSSGGYVIASCDGLVP